MPSRVWLFGNISYISDPYCLQNWYQQRLGEISIIVSLLPGVRAPCHIPHANPPTSDHKSTTSLGDLCGTFCTGFQEHKRVRPPYMSRTDSPSLKGSFRGCHMHFGKFPYQRMVHKCLGGWQGKGWIWAHLIQTLFLWDFKLQMTFGYVTNHMEGNKPYIQSHDFDILELKM